MNSTIIISTPDIPNSIELLKFKKDVYERRVKWLIENKTIKTKDDYIFDDDEEKWKLLRNKTFLNNRNKGGENGTKI